MSSPISPPMSVQKRSKDHRPLISVGQAAELAGISRSTAYAWARNGMPGLLRVNGRLWVRRAVFEGWLYGTEDPSDTKNATAASVAFERAEVRDDAARPPQ
jgi:excisionase family DNA binding protein